MSQKKNKSDSYQHKIVEILVDPSVLCDFPDHDGLGMLLNLSKCSDEFQELQEQLLHEILRIINNDLTRRQAEVVTLRLQDMTQTQIAEKLGIHQTTVHKLLMGNIDYANGKKRYGGAIKKLQKICAKDEKVKQILANMEELRAKDPMEEFFDRGRDRQNPEPVVPITTVTVTNVTTVTSSAPAAGKNGCRGPKTR